MRASALDRGVLREVVVKANAERRARQELECLWVRLYEEGWSAERLALAAGCSKNAVANALERHGVPRRYKNTGEYR